MTEANQSLPYGEPPEREHRAPEGEERGKQAERSADATPREADAQGVPPGTPEGETATKKDATEPFTIDAEHERLVWTPPLPQYPARPTREEPVQYQAPRPQPAPQYSPQTYAQPQGIQPQPAPPQAAPYPSTQPPTYASAVAAGYSPPVANPYASQGQAVFAPPAPRATKARMGRRMLRRTVLNVNRARLAIFAVRPGLVIAFIAILFLTGWFAYDKWLTGSSTPSLTPNAANSGGVVSLPPETPAVQSYLTAMQTGDTDAAWNALGAQEKAHRISRGDDKSVLAAVLKAQQQQGFSYTAYHYVAGYAKDGTGDPTKGGIYFYVADIGRGTQKTSVPMVFTMDDKGQISQVSDQLYDYMLQQLKGP